MLHDWLQARTLSQPALATTNALTCLLSLSQNSAQLAGLQVGELPIKKIPVRVSVGGTPLIMQPGRLLLTGYLPQKPHTLLQQPLGPSLQPQGTLQKPLGASLQRQCSWTRTPAGARPSVGQQEQTAGMALDFGQLLADSKAERSFHVFNTSSLAVQLDWQFQRWLPSLHCCCCCCCSRTLSTSTDMLMLML